MSLILAFISGVLTMMAAVYGIELDADAPAHSYRPVIALVTVAALAGVVAVLLR